MKRPEEKEHRTLAQYLRLIRVVWHHSPLARSNRVEAAIAHGLGATAGFPDVAIFTPPPKRLEVRGVAIELKLPGTQGTQRGEPSEAQRQWLADLERCGWLVRVCHGATDAIRWLQSLGWP